MLGTEQSQAEYFFERVLQQTKSIFHHNELTLSVTISLCDLKVRLEFARANFAAQFLDAIAHLVIPHGAEPDYVVQIWSETEVGVQMPKILGSYEDIQLRGDIPNLSNGDIKTAYFSHSRTLNCINLKTRVAIVCAKSFEEIPAFEVACPLRAIFSWILQANNMTFIHAAAVGNKQEAILIGGDSGVGKSTTAISCLQLGMDYLGDDICAISLKNNTPHVFSVYSSAKIMRQAQNQFTFLKPYQADLSTHVGTPLEKQVYFLAKMGHIANTKRLIKAIVMPSFKKPESNMQPFPKGEAARILSISTSTLIPGSNAVYLALAAQLTRLTPVFELNLAHNFDKNYASIQGLLNAATA